MKNTFQNFGLVLLISLLLINVSAFHMYEHAEPVDDVNEHCELCVLIIEGQEIEGLLPPVAVLNIRPSFEPTTLRINFSKKNYKGKEELIHIWARPPPLSFS